MKIGSLSDGSYFRIKPSCHAFGGVTPPKMKEARLAVNSIFALNAPNSELEFCHSQILESLAPESAS
jgi:hypothetical protein